MGGNRLGEEVALNNVTAHRLESINLLFGLHPFGNDGDVEKVRNVDDDLDHMGVAAGLEGTADKLHIQLQRVDGERGHHVQRRIPGSEIVHFNLETEGTETFHRKDDLNRVL